MRVVGAPSDLASFRDTFGKQRLGTAKLTWTLVTEFDPRDLLRGPVGSLNDSGGRQIRSWIDLRDRAVARLYFVDPASDRYLLRELEFERDWRAFEFETIAQVVELSITALLNDDAVGMNRIEARQRLDATLAPPRRVTTDSAPAAKPLNDGLDVRTNIVGSYAMRTYSRELPWVMGPSVAASLAAATKSFQTRLELVVGYEVPRSFRTGYGGAQLSSWTYRLRFEGLHPIDRGIRLWAGWSLALGVDLVHSRPERGTISGEYALHEPRTDTSFIVSPGGVWLVEMSEHIAFRFRIAVDVAPRPIAHAMLVEGAEVAVTKGYAVRPAAEIGLLVH